MFWSTTTIGDHQRGLRYRDGRLVGWLGPGRHTLLWPREGTRDEVIDLSAGSIPHTPELAAIVPPGAATELVVGSRQIAILRIDGLPVRTLGPGRYLLWQERAAVEARVHDTEPLHTTVAEAEWALVSPAILTPVIVEPHERVILFVDGIQAEILGPGRHGIHTEGRTVSMIRMDLREQELQITGQDMMTADKVSVRINLLVRYRITDPEQVVRSVPDLHDALYSTAQLASRRNIAATSLDALLEGRNTLGETLLDAIQAQARAWGVELLSFDLKDLILPGPIKEILNQVLQAEKRAAANVILRREETAATRSLANTAKLLDQNPTLLRLKELETMERLAQSVGPITVLAAPDQLLSALRLPPTRAAE